ncbi:MAG: FeoA family protein [Pirellulales bacterium]
MSSLAELRTGHRARVTRISGEGDISLRLMEMGITPGVDVSVVGCAPLGDPLELLLRGYHLSIRKSEARHVEVEPLDADHQ